MNLLLDTHVLLWWLADADDLGAEHKRLIAEARNGVWVSSVSVWEIAIKSGLGKLDTPDDLVDVLASSAFEELPITWSHAAAAGRLPSHHRDPFDRMLIAQARVEGLTVATVDPVFDRYEIATV